MSHEKRPIQIALVVDDFFVEYEQKEDVQYLLDALNEHYEAVEEDWEGKFFCAINLEWYYKRGTVDLRIPGYVKKKCANINIPVPTDQNIIHINTIHHNIERIFSTLMQWMPNHRSENI